MVNLYKLTDQEGKTYRGSTQWGENITHAVVKRVENPALCSDQVVHAYRNINLGILLNPVFGYYDPFRIWEAEGGVVVEDWGKVGCYSLTTTKELPIPDWYKDTYTRKWKYRA